MLRTVSTSGRHVGLLVHVPVAASVVRDHGLLTPGDPVDSHPLGPRQIRKFSLVAGTGRVALTVSVRELKEALVDNTLDDLMGATTRLYAKLRPTDDLELSVTVGRIDRRRVHGRSRILSLVRCSKTVTALRDLSDAGRAFVA